MSSPAGPRRAGLRGWGVVAGLLSGALGIGGGLVVGPALAVRGLPIRRATGTALAVVLPVALVAVVTEALTRPAQLVFGWAFAVAIGGQLGAPLGAQILRRSPELLLRTLFVALLLYVAARQLGLLAATLPPAGLPAQASPAIQAGVAFGLGVLAGVSAVLFGVGGGVVVVPGLVYLVGGLSLAAAMATSLLAMVPTAARGLWLARRDGRVESDLARALVPTALLGACGGVLLRNEVLEPLWLERAFGVFLLYAALRLSLRRPAS